jgi:hypothetical protein
MVEVRGAGQSVYVFEDGKSLLISDTMIVAVKERYVTALLASRISRAFWLDIIAINSRYGIEFLSMLQPVLDLENGTNNSRTKPATQFNKEPLKGLWHKHFFSARFLAGNISAGLGKKGMRKIVLDVVGEPDGTKVFTWAHLAEISARIVNQPLTQRAASGTRTGEWVIFLRRPEGNFYLSIAAHRMRDQGIFDRIEQECSIDFPDLPTWLREAKGI